MNGGSELVSWGSLRGLPYLLLQTVFIARMCRFATIQIVTDVRHQTTDDIGYQRRPYGRPKTIGLNVVAVLTIRVSLWLCMDFPNVILVRPRRLLSGNFKLAHSKNELIQWRGIRRLSVCKLLRKSLLLPGKWPDRHQTFTRWTPGQRASWVCSQSRWRSLKGHVIRALSWILEWATPSLTVWLSCTVMSVSVISTQYSHGDEKTMYVW